LSVPTGELLAIRRTGLFFKSKNVIDLVAFLVKGLGGIFSFFIVPANPDTSMIRFAPGGVLLSL
jgi:hypothetical protein